MHDVEGFAEEAASFVGQCAIPENEKIALIHNIYAFHDLWDTGFTKLRVYDTLIASGYFHAFEPPEHPDYEKYRDFFDNLEDSGNSIFMRTRWKRAVRSPATGWTASIPTARNTTCKSSAARPGASFGLILPAGHNRRGLKRPWS